MTPQQHLRLLRVLRLVFFGLGVLLIVPYMDVQRDVAGAKSASILLAGVGLMFVPYLLVSRFISARCPKCGGRAFATTKWQSPRHDESERTDSRIKAFRWSCEKCGIVETIPSNIIDNLIPPFIQG